MFSKALWFAFIAMALGLVGGVFSLFHLTVWCFTMNTAASVVALFALDNLKHGEPRAACIRLHSMKP